MITPGNAGTLDMLNRGEIAMGPVWVDMFYTWMADGKLPPEHEAEAGRARHARPADVLRDPRQGRARSSLAEKFVALATSPEVQAEGIVKKFNWYPGIDAKHLEGKLDHGGLEEAVLRHQPGGPRQPRASRSRSASTSTTSSRATRRR